MQYAITLEMEYNDRHFIRHLVICNPIYVKRLELMSGVITHNSVGKKIKSLY